MSASQPPKEHRVPPPHRFHVVHSIPGRVRLKHPRLKGHPVRACEITEKLSAIEGIKKVEANPTIGSLTVHYHPSALKSAEFFLKVAAALGLLVAAEILPQEVEAWLSVSEGPSLDVFEALAKALESLSSLMTGAVEQLTGRPVEAKTLLPIAMFSLGFLTGRWLG